MGLKSCNIRGLARNIQVYSLWPYRMNSYEATKYGTTLGFYLCMCLDLTAFFTQTSKVSSPCLWVGRTLQASLLGSRGRCFTQKLPATQGDQFAQSTATLYTLLLAKVHQSQSQWSELSHLWNTSIMQPSRQFLLQFLPGVLTLG